jgi:tryptophan synthase beta chain
MADVVKYLLADDEIPKSKYDIAADLPTPAPPPHPGTLNPLGPDDLAPLFLMLLIMGEVSAEREIEIPRPVPDICGRREPSPLYRARRLEKALYTAANVYYNQEEVSPTVSHKPNTSVARAIYNHEVGIRDLFTKIGGGR